MRINSQDGNIDYWKKVDSRGTAAPLVFRKQLDQIIKTIK